VRAVLQITKKARLICQENIISDCQAGMCILLGFREGDTREDADRMIAKILNMRIFQDENGKLNRSSQQVGADILVVSNFTLYANLSSRRPDFLSAMKYQPASELYRYFLEEMQRQANALSPAFPIRIFGGVFGGDMTVEITNDGPVTIVINSEEI